MRERLTVCLLASMVLWMRTGIAEEHPKCDTQSETNWLASPAITSTNGIQGPGAVCSECGTVQYSCAGEDKDTQQTRSRTRCEVWKDGCPGSWEWPEWPEWPEWTTNLVADGVHVTGWSASAGSITSDGVFTPPSEPQYVTITATLDDDAPPVSSGSRDDAPLNVSTQIAVVRVESIQPDPKANLQEIDDGDDNPKTRIFVVPIAIPLEYPDPFVVVRATLTPNLSESELPSDFTLQGGTGSTKLTRTVSRTIAAGASKTEFTFICGGTDSGFKTTVYVYDARVALFADNGGENSPQVGHSWGRYTLDSYATDLVPPASPNERQYLQEMGFFPKEPANWGQILLGNSVPGDFRLGSAAYGSHCATGSKEYPILFSTLFSALPQVDAVHSSPPYYNLFGYNCTDVAIGLGELVNVHTMDASGVSTPWVYSSWLNTH